VNAWRSMVNSLLKVSLGGVCRETVGEIYWVRGVTFEIAWIEQHEGETEGHGGFLSGGGGSGASCRFRGKA